MSDEAVPAGRQVASVRTTRMIGPNWNGTLPKGVTAVPRSRSNSIFILGRTLVDNKAEALVVDGLQDRYNHAW